MGSGLREGLEVLRGVVVAGAGDGDVFFDDGSRFLAELLGEHALQRLEADAHHAEGGADGERVLRDFVAGDVGQGADGERAELNAVGCSPGLMVSAL